MSTGNSRSSSIDLDLGKVVSEFLMFAHMGNVIGWYDRPIQSIFNAANGIGRPASGNNFNAIAVIN